MTADKEYRSVRLRRATVERLRAACSAMGVTTVEELLEKTVERLIDPVEVSRAKLGRSATTAEDLMEVML